MIMKEKLSLEFYLRDLLQFTEGKDDNDGALSGNSIGSDGNIYPDFAEAIVEYLKSIKDTNKGE